MTQMLTVDVKICENKHFVSILKMLTFNYIKSFFEIKNQNHFFTYLIQNIL